MWDCSPDGGASSPTGYSAGGPLFSTGVGDIVELLSFVVTTTYFSFSGNVFRQKLGTVTGSPVSPVIGNLFLVWLELQAIATTPITCQQ